MWYQLIILLLFATVTCPTRGYTSRNHHGYSNEKLAIEAFTVGANTLVSRIYPPASLTAFRSTLSGSGDYVISSSGFNGSTHTIISAFDEDSSTYFTSPSTYSSTTGKYTGTIQTTAVSGTVYSGEYIQIQLPVNISLTGIVYTPRNGYKMRRTPELAVLGSSDGRSWNLIYKWTSVFASSFLIPSTQSYAFNFSDTNTYYNTFRIVQFKQPFYYPSTSTITIASLAEPVYYLDAWNFNGSTTKYIGTIQNAPTNYMTISMWVIPTIYNVVLVSMARSPTRTIGEYEMSITSNGKLYYFEYSGGSTYGVTMTGLTTIPLNTRTHVAFVKNNTMGYFYINGILDASSVNAVSTTLGNTDLNFGSDYRDKNMYHSGSIDNAYIYNYAMTASEIQSTYYSLSFTQSWEISSLKLVGTSVTSTTTNYQSPYYFITDYAGTGSGSYNNDNLKATSTNLYNPNSIWFDTNGNLYITDNNNHRIRKVNGVTNIVTTIA